MAFYFQKGEGTGVESLDPRDVEEVIKDPYSKIVAKPTDDKSRAVMHIFSNATYQFADGRLIGFQYESLKDAIKWTGLKPREFVPLLQSCINYYISGINSKKK